ncbi:MAG: Gx transporter family protein [Oscillospiraceae bacterium]|nr:Gx transporter family protein [Oscillospiraceae bacterium]
MEMRRMHPRTGNFANQRHVLSLGCNNRVGGYIKTVRFIAYGGLLTALAAGLSVLERFIPLFLWVPFPGIKLGLANVVTICVLYWLGMRPAIGIIVARCFLTGFFSGGLTGFLFSLTGGLFSLSVMYLLMGRRGVSIWGVSIAGAACHSIGQIFIAVCLMKSTAPITYLPILLIAGLITGTLTAAVALGVFRVCKLKP